MTQNNTAATNTTNAAEVKEPTKMDLVRPIFKEIYSQGYKLSEGCKSQRAEFIKRSIAEAGMTKNGAATYFQNLTNEARGEPTYKYGKKKAEGQTTAGANQALDAANANNSNEGGQDDNAPGAHRWMTVNAAGEEINSYTSRDKAKKAASLSGLEWKDRNDVKGE